MYLEPVGATSVSGATLGHPYLQTLPQTAGLTRCPVLLVDDTLAVVLALRDGTRVVVRPSEERLQKKEGKQSSTLRCAGTALTFTTRRPVLTLHEMALHQSYLLVAKGS